MEEMENVEGKPCLNLGSSNLEASDVEICRICLATDVKMYSLQNTHLGHCMDSIAQYKTNYQGLPNYVCYECAPCLVKCNKIIQKSNTAQQTLQDIFAKNGEITKTLVEEHNRSELNLQSSLESYLLINYFYIKYDEDNNTSDFITTKYDPNEKINIRLKNEIKNESSDEDAELIMVKTDQEKITKCESEENEMNDSDSSDDDVEEIKTDIPVVEVISDDDTSENFISLKLNEEKNKLGKHQGSRISQKFQPKRKKVEGDIPVNTDSHKYLVDTWRGKGSSYFPFDIPLYDVPKVSKFPRQSKAKGVAKKGKKKKNKFMNNPAPEKPDQIIREHFNIEEITVQSVFKYSCKFCHKRFNYLDEAKDHKSLGCRIPKSSSNNNTHNKVPETDVDSLASPSRSKLFWNDWNGDNK